MDLLEYSRQRTLQSCSGERSYDPRVLPSGKPIGWEEARARGGLIPKGPKYTGVEEAQAWLFIRLPNKYRCLSNKYRLFIERFIQTFFKR